MPEALRSQLKWTPTGQNTDNFSIKKHNCSGLKHIKNLQTCECIMIQKTIAGVCAVYPAMSLRRFIPRNLQTACRSVASKHTQRSTLLGSKSYKCQNFRLCIIVTCQNYTFPHLEVVDFSFNFIYTISREF